MSYNRRMPIPNIRASTRNIRERNKKPQLSEVAETNKPHEKLVAKIQSGMGFPSKIL